MNRFEVGADEAPRFLEVCRFVNLLLTTLNLGLHATSCLAPLSQIGMIFLISSLISQLLILMGEPNLLQLLLLDVSCWIVCKVVASSFEFVGRGEFGLLIAIRVECLEWRSICRTFGLREIASCVGESHGTAGWWQFARRSGRRDAVTLRRFRWNRHIVDRA